MRLVPSSFALLATAACALTSTSAVHLDRAVPTEDMQMSTSPSLEGYRQTLRNIRNSILFTLAARGGLPITTKEVEFQKYVAPLLRSTKDPNVTDDDSRSVPSYIFYRRTPGQALKWGEDGSEGSTGYQQGPPTGKTLIDQYYSTLIPVFSKALNGTSLTEPSPSSDSLSALSGASYLSFVSSERDVSRHVAVVKLKADRQKYCQLIIKRDAVGIRKAITDVSTEKSAVEGGEALVKRLVPNASPELVEAVRELYVDYFFPVGKDIQVAELLRKNKAGESIHCH